jgi:hypothetical protein
MDVATPDVTHVMWGRKAIRTRDGLMRDDMRDQSTQRQNVARGSGLPDAWVTDEHSDPVIKKTGKHGRADLRRRKVGPNTRITKSTVAVCAI